MTSNPTMRAAVLVAPRRFDIRDIAVPAIGADDVLIRVSRCGVCGTDLHIFNGHYSADRLPLVPGHEFVGHVAAMGTNVRGFKEGDPVIGDINIGCGRCFYCRRNEVLNCPDMRQLGIHTNGAFAEYISLPSRLVIPLPPNVPLEVAALTEPLACVVRAAKKIGLGMAESVLILGAGPIGNLHVQLARALGAAPVIVADLDPDRAALALDCGADLAVSVPGLLRRTVLDATGGRGADVAIESVGARPLYEQAFDLIRPGGRVLAFGLTDAATRISISPLDMILRETAIRGSVAGMGEDMHQALTLLAHGRIRTDPFLGADHPLEQVQDVLAGFGAGTRTLKFQITI
jgi:2-desacetyl-2-hydroxyethyl bacteriochlorophyllide A dehydrogenase